MKKIYLKKNEERRLLAGHLWVYSNEIDTKRSSLKDVTSGEIVQFITSKDRYIATGYVNPHALIFGRVLSRDEEVRIDHAFFLQRIKTALSLREALYKKPFYRLAFAESDNLPGLIIDRYDQVFVIQTNTAGMEALKPILLDALISLFKPTTVIMKNDSAMRAIEHLSTYTETAAGLELKETLMEENDSKFFIPIVEGQKTGWFYDHRENRRKLARYVDTKSVLDVFSYVGGWGIQAATFGAKEVLCIDSSEKALGYAERNAKENNVADRVSFLKQDAFEALRDLAIKGTSFDVIILDPPALIKKRKDIEQGSIAYLRLNELAMNLIPKDGILVSCSCSLHMPVDKLIDLVRRAALKTKRQIQILEVSFQGLDHPVHPAIAETAYLKALFCRVL